MATHTSNRILVITNTLTLAICLILAWLYHNQGNKLQELHERFLHSLEIRQEPWVLGTSYLESEVIKICESYKNPTNLERLIHVKEIKAQLEQFNGEKVTEQTRLDLENRFLKCIEPTDTLIISKIKEALKMPVSNVLDSTLQKLYWENNSNVAWQACLRRFQQSASDYYDIISHYDLNITTRTLCSKESEPFEVECSLEAPKQWTPNVRYYINESSKPIYGPIAKVDLVHKPNEPQKLKVRCEVTNPLTGYIQEFQREVEY